jgi:hypothetical protein
MREAAMSAELFVARAAEAELAQPQDKKANNATGWNPENFGREQVRGLVRQLFLSKVERSVRQVVFSAVDRDTDVRSLCRQVGEVLALETQQRIAVVGEYPQTVLDDEDRRYADEGKGQQRDETHLGKNLWLVPPAGNEGDEVTTPLLHSHLGGIRTRFEYSILVGPPASCELNVATAMAQLADGIVLVLSANHTRRITARRIKQGLASAGVCILGTVLSGRTFPIPEGIYRRL